MRLDALDGRASVSPHLNLAVLAASIAPAFLVEADRSEESGCVRATQDAWLFEPLGDIGWVPEGHLLGSHRGKPQIPLALGPSHVENAIS